TPWSVTSKNISTCCPPANTTNPCSWPYWVPPSVTRTPDKELCSCGRSARTYTSLTACSSAWTWSMTTYALSPPTTTPKASPPSLTATSFPSSTANSTQTSTPCPSTILRSGSPTRSGSRCVCGPAKTYTYTWVPSTWRSISRRGRRYAPRSPPSSAVRDWPTSPKPQVSPPDRGGPTRTATSRSPWP